MIIDSNIGSVFNCSYKIALASKFSKFEFNDSMNDCINNANYSKDINFRDLLIESKMIFFTISVAPDETVKAKVTQARRAMTNSLLENEFFEESPLLSSSFYCVTLKEDGDIVSFKDALKPSYRIKRGELY